MNRKSKGGLEAGDRMAKRRAMADAERGEAFKANVTRLLLGDDKPDATEGATLAEIQRLMKSPAYLNARDPGHSVAIGRVSNLFASIRKRPRRMAITSEESVT